MPQLITDFERKSKKFIEYYNHHIHERRRTQPKHQHHGMQRATSYCPIITNNTHVDGIFFNQTMRSLTLSAFSVARISSVVEKFHQKLNTNEQAKEGTNKRVIPLNFNIVSASLCLTTCMRYLLQCVLCEEPAP